MKMKMMMMMHRLPPYELVALHPLFRPRWMTVQPLLPLQQDRNSYHYKRKPKMRDWRSQLLVRGRRHQGEKLLGTFSIAIHPSSS
jgi:hypothetical protein